MKKAYIDINFPLIHFVFAQKCLVQVLQDLSKISTYKEEEGKEEKHTDYSVSGKDQDG